VFFETPAKERVRVDDSTDLTEGNTSGILFSDTARRLARAQSLKPTGTSARPFRLQTNQFLANRADGLFFPSAGKRVFAPDSVLYSPGTIEISSVNIEQRNYS